MGKKRRLKEQHPLSIDNSKLQSEVARLRSQAFGDHAADCGELLTFATEFDHLLVVADGIAAPSGDTAPQHHGKPESRSPGSQAQHRALRVVEQLRRDLRRLTDKASAALNPGRFETRDFDRAGWAVCGACQAKVRRSWAFCPHCQGEL